MSNHTTLALDLGTSCGWAKSIEDTIAKSGVIDLKIKDAHPGIRFMRFKNWLVEHGADANHIVYERVPRFASADAARVHCGLLAVVQMYCVSKRIRMTSIMPKVIKKEFTGNGNADKVMMCRVNHKLGWKGGHPDTDVDHDESDARAILWVALTRDGCAQVIVP